jgi:hypothetical protein
MSAMNGSVDYNDKKRKNSSKKDSGGSIISVSTDMSTTTNSSKKRRIMANKKRANGKASVCSVDSIISSDSSSIHTGSNSSWLPPISSLMLPTFGASSSSPPLSFIRKDCYPEKLNFHQSLHGYAPLLFTEPLKPKPKPTVMPMIPYFFHHKQFGIEACMLQLEEQKRQQIQRRYHYTTKIGNHNYFYYL